jgi:hypothetical protein
MLCTWVPNINNIISLHIQPLHQAPVTMYIMNCSIKTSAKGIEFNTILSGHHIPEDNNFDIYILGFLYNQPIMYLFNKFPTLCGM